MTERIEASGPQIEKYLCDLVAGRIAGNSGVHVAGSLRVRRRDLSRPRPEEPRTARVGVTNGAKTAPIYPEPWQW